MQVHCTVYVTRSFLYNEKSAYNLMIKTIQCFQHKNAFDLQLIEHMGEMIKQDGGLNFRVAGGTIFAGAQIYASRVDALHSQIYRSVIIICFR